MVNNDKASFRLVKLLEFVNRKTRKNLDLNK